MVTGRVSREAEGWIEKSYYSVSGKIDGVPMMISSSMRPIDSRLVRHEKKSSKSFYILLLLFD